MVWNHTRVYRTTFRKLPTGAIFNISSSNAGPLIKTKVNQYQTSQSDGITTKTDNPDRTTAVKRWFLHAAYTDA